MIERISHRDTFRRLYADGDMVRRGGMTCRWIPDPSLPAPRVAYALSRHVGSAVRRNRLRRQLRAIVNSLAQEIPVGWLLISLSPTLSTASSPELTRLMRAIISEISASAQSTPARS
ncbi:MAG: ribonuclease P protein component [Ilumatobacteraceae bacterium]